HAEEHGHHNHEPMLMILPLIVLAIGAIFADYLNFPCPKVSEFLGRSPSLQYAYELASIRYAGEAHPLTAEAFGVVEKTAAATEHAFNAWPMIIGRIVAIAGISLAYLP